MMEKIPTPAADALLERAVELAIEVRRKALLRNEVHLARDVEQTLEEFGVTLEDTPHGTRWRKRNG